MFVAWILFIHNLNIYCYTATTMQFTTPLVHGTLIKRYKRFLSDIRLTDGAVITAHCPNTGSMLSCSTPGSEVGLSISENPKRKYPHTLEMIKVNDTWVGVNTSLTNKLVIEAIKENRITEFAEFDTLQPEVSISKGTRLDLLVTRSGHPTYIEIKNCSLAENGRAMFPDAVTARGTKHLKELTSLCREGKGACIFYLVQRMDVDSFSPATHIDPTYGAVLQDAIAAGVMPLVYQAEVTPAGIQVVRQLPCVL